MSPSLLRPLMLYTRRIVTAPGKDYMPARYAIALGSGSYLYFATASPYSKRLLSLMHIKEPFYDHDVSYKEFFLPIPGDLKVPPSIDHCKSVKFHMPALKGSSRRGSMEPYFPQRRYSQQSSSSSSYAKLSDVFDYNYLNLFHGAENENAIASDSDTDYEDYMEEQTLKPSFVLKDHEEGSLSDSESDLEDYKVHLLTFKVNSNAQYTRPPCNKQSSSTDHFDFRPTQGQMAFLPTSQHPDFPMVSIPSSSSAMIFEEPEIELERFLQACDNPLAGLKGRGPERMIQAAPFKEMMVSDYFTPGRTKTTVSDIYETNHAPVSYV